MDIKKIVSKANLLYSNNKFVEAMGLYKKVLPVSNFNDTGILYYNIGLCHLSLMNYKAAIINFTKALNEYNYTNAGYELCLSYLFNNDYKKGMDLYDYRYKGTRDKFPNLPIKHLIHINDCLDKKVLVLNEQGFGDEILFSRVIETLSKKVSSADYQVYDETKELFEHLYNFDNITYITNRTLSFEYVMDFDGWISTGDLFSSFTKDNMCLYKEPDFNLSGVEKIGLCWKANIKSKSAIDRSIDIDDLDDQLFDIDFEYYSLQLNECSNWMKETNLNGFYNTYLSIKDLDLIITVDTVTCHLAGLMGKKVILIYKKHVDWRWNYDLYPNIKKVNINNLNTFLKNEQI